MVEGWQPLQLEKRRGQGGDGFCYSGNKAGNGNFTAF